MKKSSVRHLFRTISIILVTSIIITMIPSQTFSQPESGQTETDLSPSRILGEIIDKRDKNSKTFLKADNTMVAVVSSDALHYKDTGGKWQDIDNTLTPSNDEAGAPVYTNTKNDFKASLPPTFNASTPIIIEKDGYKLSMMLVDGIGSDDRINETDIKLTQPPLDATAVKSDAMKRIKTSNKSSIATFVNVKPDTDISYIIEPQGIKENIIVKQKPSDPLVYKYKITASGLEAVLNQDRSIGFFTDAATGSEPEFIMPPPIMYDASDVTSTDIEVTLAMDTDGYILTYSPSSAWVTDNDRDYPVTIDPAVQTTKDTTNVDDSYVCQVSPGANYGTATSMFIGRLYIPSTANPMRAFVKFNTLPILDPGSVITGSKVYLNSAETADAEQINAHQVTQSWTETGITWTNATSIFSSTIADFKPAGSVNGYSSWDITGMTKGWYANGGNYGMMLKYNNETTATTNLKNFNTSENTNASLRPYMEIQYTNANGSTANTSYHTMDVGRAGAVSVNDYTGNINVARTDIGYPGNNMPVDISMIYNTTNKDVNITNCSGGFDRYGAGWQTSYNQTIKYHAVDANNPVSYYAYIAEDGRIIYFENTPDAAHPSASFSDSGGSGYSLSVDPDALTDYSNVRILDPSGRILSFDSQGRLVKIAGNVQTIKRIFSVGEYDYYYYVSGDGSEVYFDKVTTTPAPTDPSLMYADAGASGYSITVTPGSLDDMTKVTVSNASTRQTLTFDSNGDIATQNDKDIVKMSIDISYETSETASCAIDKIIDGNGREYRFVYDGTTKRLNTISYYGSGATALATVSYYYYANNTLDYVKYPDDNNTTKIRRAYYTWNADKTLLTIKNTDNYHLNFGYTAGVSPKVSSIIEHSTTDTAGTSVGLTYGNNSTKYTDNNTSKYLIIQFDNYGNVLSQQDSGGNAIFGGYMVNTGSSRNPNRLVSVSNLQKTAVNLLLNGIAYSSAGWTGTGNYSIANDQKLLGSNSFKLNNPTTSTSSYLQAVSLAADKYFILSAYVKTSGITATSGNGAKLDVSGNIDQIQTSEVITGTNDWKRIYISFHTISATTLTSYIKLLSASGTAWFDGVQLEYANTTATIGPGGYNLVENGGFEKTTYVGFHIPNSWSYSGSVAIPPTSNVTATTNSSPAGPNYMNLLGNPTANNNFISQTIDAGGVAGDQYSFGGWAKSMAVPLSEGRTFEIRADLLDINSVILETYHAQFNPAITDWQYTMSGFTAQNIYSKIKITIDYSMQMNLTGFDGIQLYKIPFGTTFSYDATGKLINTREVSQQEPAQDDDILNSLPDKSSYTADSFGNMTGAVTGEGVGSVSGFDGFNNLVRAATTNGRQTIETSSTYTADGNYIATSTDEAGNTTAYGIDSDLGTLDTVTDADNETTSYGYDKIGNLTSVSKTAGGVSLGATYAYDSGDRLQTITHNSFSYTFGYDILGAPSTVSVGGMNLLTNNYNTLANGYTLNNTVFANGQTLNYEYDSNNSLKSVKYNSEQTPRYSFYYDNDGNVASTVDTINNIQTSYVADSEGILHTTQTGISGNPYTHSYLTNDNGYNTSSFIEFIYNTGAQPFITNIVTDKDGRANGANYTLPDNTFTSNEIAYDDLGRVIGRNLYKKNAAGTITTNLLSTSIGYPNYAQYKTSNQVNTISLSNASGYDRVLSYQYDKLGNITYDSGTSYVYDEAGQLTRINDPATGTIVYVYDAGGNITVKTTYAYTQPEDIPSNPQSTATYVYDSTWKDKLISYNNNGITNITYDNIGNPLGYYNGYTFSWEMGRMLAGVTGNGKTISYLCDSNGIRTKKTVNGTSTSFTLKDSRIDYQTDGTDSMYFRYNGDDSLIGLEWNGVDYYYVKNLQGDIISVLDNTGASVVEYTYDAWGKPLATTGTLATTLGVKNPFRYRGYYYDTETGLYYLQSRYYDPNTGRFINADNPSILRLSAINVLGVNLFAYCWNNPVNYSDSSGMLPLWAKIAIGIVGITAAVIITVASGGSALPALIAVLQNVLGSMVISMAIYGIIGYITGGIAGLKQGLLNGAADGFMWGGIGSALSAASKLIKLAKAGKVVTTACFVKGTLIATEEGYVPIEEIRENDLVYSENPETGEKELKRVEHAFSRQTNEFIHIQVDGQNITTTAEHPFWLPQVGWTDAGDLRAGDKLVLRSGEYVIIEKIQHEMLETPTTVYNFEVEGFHTYYVTDSEILVHNANCYKPLSPNTLSKSLAKSFTDKYGYNSVEAFKETYVGKSAISRFDLVKDTKTGIIWLKDKAGKIWINTGLK